MDTAAIEQATFDSKMARAEGDHRRHARGVEIAAAAGLPVEAARDVLEQRSFEAVVDADWAKSRDYGVTGVPTFVAGGYGVVGAQPYEALEQLMTEVGAPERSGDPTE